MEHLIGLLWWFMNQGGDIEGTRELLQFIPKDAPN